MIGGGVGLLVLIVVVIIVVVCCCRARRRRRTDSAVHYGADNDGAILLAETPKPAVTYDNKFQTMSEVGFEKRIDVLASVLF